MKKAVERPHDWYRRHFLNKPQVQTSAHFIGRIVCRGGKRGGRPSVDTVFRLSDCNRMIDLEFDVYGEDSSADSVVYKAERLRDDVDTFVERLLDAVEWWRAEERAEK